MKITGIALANFRSFKKKVEIVSLKKITIFVGPNGAGKSNVFEALSL
jgi:AAA15 family ATPase/GTPase